MQKMKANVFHATDAIRVEEVPLPRALELEKQLFA